MFFRIPTTYILKIIIEFYNSTGRIIFTRTAWHSESALGRLQLPVLVLAVSYVIGFYPITFNR